MILTLTANPALDVTYRVEHLQVGSSYRVAPTVAAGGKGINVARVAARLGHRVATTGPLGGANGNRIRRLLQDDAVEQRFVPSAAPTRQTVNITSDGDATIFNEAGADQPDSLWQTLACQLRDEGAQVVTICGSFPPHTPAGVLRMLVEAAKEGGSLVVVDTSGPLLLEAASAGADLLKPNEAELAAATGAGEVAAGAARLLQLGARVVVCSLGAEGVAAFTAHVQVSQPPATLVHGNPTGAGDSLVASLASQMEEAGQLPQSKDELSCWLRKTSALAAATVAAPTAGAFDPALYQKLLEE